jgi:hypothetical protein
LMPAKTSRAHKFSIALWIDYGKHFRFEISSQIAKNKGKLPNRAPSQSASICD